ncbi:MAG TPA: JAB domain-containing protein [Candidatus Nitrosotalea sp.]|nr:JAB domain-containing protein [Candidatus Nitrosotalea sp.]
MTTNEPIERVSLGSRRTIRLLTTKQSCLVAEPGPRLSGPACAAGVLMRLIGEEDREHFVALHLDTAHHIVAAVTVSIGTLNQALIHPREVFKAAILSNAQSIICGHNHPSGDVVPSKEDRFAARKLEAAGELLGIPVLDFLIVSSTAFHSLKEER